MVRVAVGVPAAAGVNVTEIVQSSPIPRVAGQVVEVALKSLALVPETANDATTSDALPESVTVRVWAALVVPPCP
jgi:hypothetical protein